MGKRPKGKDVGWRDSDHKKEQRERSGKRSRRTGEPKKSDMKPKNIDEQEIPYKVREIMRSQQKMMKQLNKKKKKTEKPERKPTSMAKNLHEDIPVPKFKRRKRESERAYIQRMEEETQHVMLLTKNQVARCPELETEKEEKASTVKSKSEKKKEFDKKRLAKFIKKKAERKEMKLEKEMFTDIVRFGEVAMQPPTLTAKPRKSQANDQPGQRQLLLKSLIQQSKCTPGWKIEGTQYSKLPTISMARQRMMLEERERIIKAYRTLKKQKQQTLSQSKDGMEKLKNPK
ncbi:coiled-coil domain-containing protein 137 [Stegostoma tigrinum]|uniref:coiled-coil domain-containing protein 137 n=1 Tax=Stegostoma tigrinum TaxID=3053191 RepID=UPI00202B47A5|nr:coiled-coil domain-containing protein 137 [Stegostoma tigrinum]